MKRLFAILALWALAMGVAQAVEEKFCVDNTACTISTFFYLDSAPEDFQAAPTLADADFFWQCDGATEVTGGSCAICLADVTDRGIAHSIVIAAGDINGVTECSLAIQDQTATKTFLDKGIIIRILLTEATVSNQTLEDMGAVICTVSDTVSTPTAINVPCIMTTPLGTAITEASDLYQYAFARVQSATSLAVGEQVLIEGTTLTTGELVLTVKAVSTSSPIVKGLSAAPVDGDVLVLFP